MTKTILGIDISKDKFDCCFLLENSKHNCSLANTPTGFKQLRAKITDLKLEHLHAGLEATGRYGNAVAQFIHDQGFTVSVINPRCIKSYGSSKMLRNKTDKSDATLIAQFIKETNPEPWVPLSRAQLELQELTRLLQNRKESLTMEKNRLSSAPQSKTVIKEIKSSINNMERSIQRLEKAIAAHVKKHSELSTQADLLCTIPGIGVTTAAIILAELPPVELFKSSSQAAAYAGVTPREVTSGSSIRGKTRLCKTGNRHLRRALYFPAITGWTHNPILSAKASRMLAAGKSKMCIIGALMHKLLRIAFGVLKHKKAFDPLWQRSHTAKKDVQEKKLKRKKVILVKI